MVTYKSYWRDIMRELLLSIPFCCAQLINSGHLTHVGVAWLKSKPVPSLTYIWLTTWPPNVVKHSVKWTSCIKMGALAKWHLSGCTGGHSKQGSSIPIHVWPVASAAPAYLLPMFHSTMIDVNIVCFILSCHSQSVSFRWCDTCAF